MLTDLYLVESKWDTPLDLQKDSKICYDCAKKITTVLLDRRISRNKDSDKIIGKLLPDTSNFN